MATTGFWPVKNSLKDVINYTENPKKTSLDKALNYIENSSKTDRQFYVTAINCPTKKAYEYMMETKKRFGKLGGNVAYHGYQSFTHGEVTPDEAHKIGLKTAKRMWGDKYEIVVTTHLNTENIHNHIVINSVSFKTGKKFQNHISDHYKFREFSDAVCLEYGKSILQNSRFYKNKDYWVHKKGKLSHRDILRQDIDEAIANTTTWRSFETYLRIMGYRYARGENYKHLSIIADGWKRPIRLSSLGEKYTPEKINERLIDNWDIIFVPQIPKRYTPLLIIEYKLRKTQNLSSFQLTFNILIILLKLITNNQDIEGSKVKPLSPTLRKEVLNLDKLINEYNFITKNNITSLKQLNNFINTKSNEIVTLQNKRYKIRNKIRRATTTKELLKTECKQISAQIRPLRKELETAKSINERYEHILNVLNTERKLEEKVIKKQQSRDL